MAGLYDHFCRRRSPIQSDELRTQLTNAILNNDAHEFRRLLVEHHPEICNDYRLFVALSMKDGKMTVLMVDNHGVPFPRDSVIQPNTPMEQLNVTFDGDEMTVKVGDDVWKAKCAPPQSAEGENPRGD